MTMLDGGQGRPMYVFKARDHVFKALLTVGESQATLKEYLDVTVSHDRFEVADETLSQVHRALYGQVVTETAFLRAFLLTHQNDHVATAAISAEIVA